MDAADCTLILADSSDASATWLEPAATCAAASRTELTIERSPCVILAKASASVSWLERGWIATDRSPPAIASETVAISFRYSTISRYAWASWPISSIEGFSSIDCCKSPVSLILRATWLSSPSGSLIDLEVLYAMITPRQSASGAPSKANRDVL